MAYDTSIKRVDSTESPHGSDGQVYLATGQSLSMRLWIESAGDTCKSEGRDYETIGYVINGTATLSFNGESIELNKGDSWLVPKNAPHKYVIQSDFLAVEATAPPAHIHGRDESS